MFFGRRPARGVTSTLWGMGVNHTGFRNSVQSVMLYRGDDNRPHGSKSLLLIEGTSRERGAGQREGRSWPMLSNAPCSRFDSEASRGTIAVAVVGDSAEQWTGSAGAAIPFQSPPVR